MKKSMIMVAAFAAVSAVSAAPILWDITDASANHAVVADFTAGGVSEDLTGATVQNVIGKNNSTMTDTNGVTLSYISGSSVNTSVNGADMTGVAGGMITKDYLYIRDNSEPVQMQIGGLSSSLTANTDYSFYIWGVGDNVGQSASFAFGGVTNAIQSLDPDVNSADNFVAAFSFTTGNTVDDTLDFDWDRTDTRWAGLNGFAIVAVPEPATFGLIGIVGGAMLFIRRRFMI
jgi:hypothetical protein